MSDSEGGPDVLVKGAHDNDGQRGVKKVVAPDKPAVKNTLAKILVGQSLVNREDRVRRCKKSKVSLKEKDVEINEESLHVLKFLLNRISPGKTKKNSPD